MMWMTAGAIILMLVLIGGGAILLDRYEQDTPHDRDADIYNGRPWDM